MPTESTPADISDAYVLGWKLGLKALAVYRDGSKLSQPLSTQSNEKKTETAVAQPRRERLPDTRSSLTHKFNVNGHEGYITVGLYPDGRPGELFITMAKEGSTFGGLMDAFGTAVSMSLQYGVPLEVLVNKFSHARFEPMGFTTNKDIRIATSVVDYIFRWLAIAFLARATHNDCKPGHANEHGIGANNAEDPELNGTAAKANGVTGSNGNGFKSAIGAASATEQNEHFASYQSDAPACDHCGAITVRSGNCYLCHNCGNSMGCS